MNKKDFMKVLGQLNDEQYNQFMEGLSSLAGLCILELELRKAANCIIMTFIDDNDGQPYELIFQKVQEKSPQTIASEFRKELIELVNDIEVNTSTNNVSGCTISTELLTRLQEKYYGAE